MISFLFELAAFLWFLQCGPWPCGHAPYQPLPTPAVVQEVEAP